MKSHRRNRMRITRAVRRGQAMTDPAEARLALERVADERRGLRRARRGYLAIGLFSFAGVVVGLLGPFALFLLSYVVLQAVVVTYFFGLRRLERNLDRSEELNRVAAGRP